jgi:hypothetical protein
MYYDVFIGENDDKGTNICTYDLEEFENIHCKMKGKIFQVFYDDKYSQHFKNLILN